jgi:hypothetical protein
VSQRCIPPKSSPLLGACPRSAKPPSSLLLLPNRCIQTAISRWIAAMPWQNVNSLGSRTFQCGFCGFLVASDRGYFHDSKRQFGVRICPNCERPTFFEADQQVPGVAPGSNVNHVPQEIAALYQEARSAIAANAPTAAVLACRKLLMNIAVSRGAKAGESFVHYVEYLAKSGFVPPDGKGWVDHIRKRGNEANHEIALMSNNDATELVSFAEMLLKFIFEFPNRIPKPGTG